MDNHFRILSLSVHEGGNNNLLKALKPGVEYLFYQDEDTAPAWLYDIPGGPKVSLSCIVGKNGDGKSSITEMMIRVINNFAYLAGFRENQQHLNFIPHVRATIKYSVGEVLCSLSCFDDRVSLSVEGKEPLEFIRGTSSGDIPRKQRLKDVRDYLFYMFVSNYSLNSFNSNDFLGETGNKYDWLSPLFHKNDGYQTPVNLNPMRDGGQIDINREHELSKQRLMSLFTEATEVEKNSRSNSFAVPTGEGFIFSLSQDSKLAKRTFQDYFAKNRSVQHSESKIALDAKTHISFWNRNANLILGKRDFIESVHRLIKRSTKKRTDFSNYLEQIMGLLDDKKKRYPDSIVEVIRLLQSFPRFSFLEFQRVFMVIWLERRWNESRLLSKPFEINSVAVKKDNLKINAQKYIIYKTVSAFETYPLLFEGCIGKIEKPINFFAYPSDENGFEVRMEHAFKILLEDIRNDKSYITLKIRQCINYLNHFSDYEKWNLNRQGNTQYKVPGKDYTHYISFRDLLKLIRKNTKGPVLDFLPPPIFEGEIILRSSDKVYPTSHISSGERQMLNMVGAVVYHLRNLGSSLDKERSIRYKNIHVCLDEIELCFHPAYQRDMVNYLLGQISAAHLSEDMNINISLLTHSPFVLSDVPQGNILYLREGEPVNKDITVNPFAANVNDILQQSFFMANGFTGTFASAKINSLISFLTDENQTVSSYDFWDEKKIEQFISIIGEPLMRMELTRLFWNWKKRNGGNARDDTKLMVEEMVHDFGGTVKW